MSIQLFKSLWGMEHLSYRESIEQIAAAGYDGVESTLPAPEHTNEFMELLQEHQLGFIALIGSSGATVSAHEEVFAAGIERAAAFRPLLAISHSARDCWSFEDQFSFFRSALRAEQAAGVRVGHETHRHRAMYTPWNTAKLLQELPDLRITADFSHWCCVCETLLEDQGDALRIAFERTIHIHARVGYAQGPQVPHPAAPEYAPELQRHELWWSSILAQREKQGFTSTTVTPEFGPPGYMHTLPFTRQPVSDLWDTCLWMGERMRAKFK
ncbi:sugar phosphate isomerase/epimerase [Paenibacillus sp. CF384]|uniref:sugar phosphate isomerase/epimerase family protein n=1 Tax=Paenibacillus sp. CF384 TaxID=1884382 RepID=UPI0008999883|nr:TIM barrel protein [Paenibacillus sp. CF384]SDW46857.1 Sugar phosphate isomerase/epimerase [Paenibacillus sp. CF384]